MMRWGGRAAGWVLGLLGLTGCPSSSSDSATGRDGGGTADGGTVLDGRMLVQDPRAPRPLRPMSATIVTHRRPTLRFSRPPELQEVRIQLCRDPGCRQLEHDIPVNEGTTARPPEDLDPGWHFWRVTGRDGATTRISTSWNFRVLNRQTEVDTAYFGGADFNGDGLSDIAVGVYHTLYIAYGSRSTYLTPPARFELPPEPEPQYEENLWTELVAADQNGDGFTDLIASEHNRRQSVGRKRPAVLYSFRGSPRGLELNPTIIRTGASVWSSSVPQGLGDINGDGYGDVLINSVVEYPVQENRRQYFLLGSSGSSAQLVRTDALSVLTHEYFVMPFSVQPISFPMPTGPLDFNADHIDDLAVLNIPNLMRIVLGPLDDSATERNTGVRYSNCDEPCIPPGVVITPDPVQRCDRNGDGRVEILRPSGWFETATTTVLLETTQSSRRIVRVQSLPRTAVNHVICAQDIDGDGATEVVAAVGRTNAGDPTRFLDVIRWTMEGEQLTTTDIQEVMPSVWIASISGTGDVNGDGMADVAVTTLSRSHGLQLSLFTGGSRHAGLRPVLTMALAAYSINLSYPTISD